MSVRRGIGFRDESEDGLIEPSIEVSEWDREMLAPWGTGEEVADREVKCDCAEESDERVVERDKVEGVWEWALLKDAVEGGADRIEGEYLLE